MNTIAVKNDYFIDEHKRQRIFHGFNFVNKGEGHCGRRSYMLDWDENMFRDIAAKGMNIVRLGIIWAGVEKIPGEYDTAYLDSIGQTLDICEKYGIYVFLDWHQDLYSDFERDYPGDGAPMWATFRPEKCRTPRIIWGEDYFLSKTVKGSFDAFWNNEKYKGKGLQEYYCDMLHFVASYFKDKKALIGFDLMNEPYPGTPGAGIYVDLVKKALSDILFHPEVDRKKIIAEAKNKNVLGMAEFIENPRVFNSIISAGKKTVYEFDTGHYYSFFKRASTAIRSVFSDKLIFMENCYFSNIAIPCSTPRVTYDDGTTEEKLVFSPHGYDITVDTPLANTASNKRVDMIFGEHKKTQQRLSCPVLVGEWGGMVPGSNDYPALEHLLDLFDSYKWSNTYWHVSREIIDCKITDILARPYPYAVAGEIKDYCWDRNTNSFTLRYDGNYRIKAPTEIYLGRKPKKVFSTAPYTITEDNGRIMLIVQSKKGPCVVTAEF